MSLAQNDWTVERLRELPDDGNRYEVIDGVLLVSPSPSAVHQRAVGELHLLLAPYVAQVGMEDTASRNVERWRPGDEEPEILFETLVWHPRDDVAALSIDVVALFRAVHGE